MLKIVELFAGIGAWSKALQRICDFKIVDAIEIDKRTMRSYNLIHGTDFQPRDITHVNESDIPDCDVIFYSPPCQSWSKAGAKRGFFDERGKVFLEALRIINAKKPMVAVMENVPNLMNFIHELREILSRLESAGYISYINLMNPMNHGFPHSRERLFIVSIRKDIKVEYRFPEKEPLTKRFADFLINDVNCYLHSQKGIDYMNRVTTRGRTHWDFAHHNDTAMQYCRCVTANYKKGVPYNVLIDRRFGEPIIRKHSPLEVFRLMGFDDEDYQVLKSNKISNTMIYQMAGNSIVVDLLEKLLSNVLIALDKNKI